MYQTLYWYNVGMLVGMPDAAKRLGLSNGDSARRALRNAGIPLVQINQKAFAVDEDALAAFVQKRAEYRGMGRPRKGAEPTGPEASA